MNLFISMEPVSYTHLAVLFLIAHYGEISKMKLVKLMFLISQERDLYNLSLIHISSSSRRQRSSSPAAVEGGRRGRSPDISGFTSFWVCEGCVSQVRYSREKRGTLSSRRGQPRRLASCPGQVARPGSRPCFRRWRRYIIGCLLYTSRCV